MGRLWKKARERTQVQLPFAQLQLELEQESQPPILIDVMCVW